MSVERFLSVPSKLLHSEFISKVFRILLKDAVFEGTERKNPVIRWREPSTLKELIDFKLHDSPTLDGELIQILSNVVKYSVKTGHPYFLNQLFSGLDAYGLVGQIVADCLNPSVYTYEVAPVFTLMEMEVLNEMRKLVGFQEGDGIFCPGGSFANGFAINLARYKLNPNFKEHGSGVKKQLVLFASEDAHYSVYKMAAFLGIGERNVVQVRTDCCGRMDVNDLKSLIEKSIDNGDVPFLIFATAGTTVLGVFDPIEALSAVRDHYKIWLHVDAAWGGGVLFSTTHKHLVKGIEKADSVTWNPHKLLAVPQQCSVLLVSHSNILHACHSRQAEYLFQKDKFYDSSFDVGDKYLQCGRRADVVKFWLMWKAKGSAGFEQHVDSILSVSDYLASKIRQHDDFILVSEPQFVNVCFWYITPQLSKMKNRHNYYRVLHKVAPVIKEKMVKRGTMMINYQPLRSYPNFFRFVTQNSGITRTDVDFILKEIEKLGRDVTF